MGVSMILLGNYVKTKMFMVAMVSYSVTMVSLLLWCHTIAMVTHIQLETYIIVY